MPPSSSSAAAPRNPHPNRVAAEVEEKILDYALAKPSHGAQRVANELRLQGVSVSSSGVRGVWSRHDIETRYKRLMRLEAHARDDTFLLSEEQVKLLERHSADFSCRHVESSAPGELLNQDTFYWGTLKGVGKVYVQVVIDTFCSLGCGFRRSRAGIPAHAGPSFRSMPGRLSGHVTIDEKAELRQRPLGREAGFAATLCLRIDSPLRARR